MAASPSGRRLLVLIVAIAVCLCFLFVSSLQSSTLDRTSTLSSKTTRGHAIAAKLGNETAKADLGRASWKLFHTMMAQFPDKPTEDESQALKSYIHLFQRLYPCGECAEHFGQILERYPPQVSSRSNAAAWACHVHNEVNKSLKKPVFDCSKIGDFYDCGCGDGEDEDKEPVSDEKEIARARHAPKEIPLDEREPVKLRMEDYQRGG